MEAVIIIRNSDWITSNLCKNLEEKIKSLEKSIEDITKPFHTVIMGMPRD